MRYFFAIILLTSFLAGCGGSGGSSGPSGLSGAGFGPVSADSPFQASFEGYWIDGEQDALRLTVRQDGRFTGEVEDPFIPTAAAVTGNVRDDGTLAAAYQFPDRDRVSVTGTVFWDNDSRLVLKGILRLRSSEGTRDVQIVLNRQ